MELNIFARFRRYIYPPHPTFQSRQSRNRVFDFLAEEQLRTPNGIRLNVGSGGRVFEFGVLNLDLILSNKVDIQGDLLNLPIKAKSVDTIICTGVLEHVSDPAAAVDEIFRTLKTSGKVFFETPFIQTIHASPDDYFRWTPEGLKRLLCDFEISAVNVVAGPASALAWQFQETMAMLFSFNKQILYKIGLRIFGWLAIPISWMDILLEKRLLAWRAASGYAVVAVKSSKEVTG
jgi:SAM-dependent methyltransferase